MPAFEPFRATRYSPALSLAAVTAPPYDVLSERDVGVSLSVPILCCLPYSFRREGKY